MRLQQVRRAKLGMTVQAAPTGNVEPEAMIAREWRKATRRGRELMGEARFFHQLRMQERIPRVKPPAIVPASRRRART